MPSTTKLMENFLDEIIEEYSYSSFERAIEPVGKEEYLKDEYFNRREVLVGALKSKEQLEANLKHNFYHIPVRKLTWLKIILTMLHFHNLKAHLEVMVE